jgi:hypothetical protein
MLLDVCAFRVQVVANIRAFLDSGSWRFRA